VAMVGLAIARPGDASAYARVVGRAGPAGGAAVVVSNALAVPTMAVWLMEPAMGGCLEINGSGVFRPYCFLSYGNYAGRPIPGQRTISGFPALRGAPPAFYLFLLLPALAVLAGGVRAARRGQARSRVEAAWIGAMAGLVFGVGFVLAIAQATVSARLNGALFIVASGFWRYGPNPATGFQLGVWWGLLGGAAGGLFAGVRRAAPPSPSSPPP